MLARVFVVFGGLLVIALSSLLLAPYFVDWAGYRSAFEQEASRIIGQPVRVEGTASARILPFPSVTFSDVVIDGPDGIPAAHLASFSMDAELAPFFSGEILIFDMRIDRPDLRLKLTENGAFLWNWSQGDVLKGGNIALENVTVIDGRVTLERAGFDPILLNGINGNVSAQALSGPWLASGRFINGTTTYDARFSTAAAIAGETLRMRLSLMPQGGFYEAAFDGRVLLQNEALGYAGKVDITALGTAPDATGKRQKLADIKGDFLANMNSIKLTNTIFTGGPSDKPYTAVGSMGLTFGNDAQFDVVLKGQPIRFGDIEGNTKADRVSLGVPLAERFNALQAALIQIPVPDIPGSVDLSLPALVIGDTIVRNAEIKAIPAKSGWQIERYSIELPGRTLVEGNGDFRITGEMAFEGQMTVACKQPTGLMNWLGLNANDAIRALPNVGLSARVNVTAARQTLRDVEFRAGDAVLRGLIDRQVPTDVRPQISVQLEGENANLDVLSSIFDLAETEKEVLHVQDIDVSLTSKPVSGFGFQAERLTIVALIEAGAIDIKQAQLTGLSSADISISGQLSQPFLEPKGALDVSVSAVDPVPFIDALAARFPAQDWLATFGEKAAFAGTALADGKLTATLKFGDDIEGTAFPTVRYQFDGAGLRFDGSLKTLASSEIAITANGEADNGDTLLAAMGLPVGDSLVALNVLDAVRFEISTLYKTGLMQSGSLKAVTDTDIFETGLGQGVQPFNLALADSAAYAMAAGYVLPGAAFGLPLTLNGEWENAGSMLRLQNIQGVFVDVPVSGQLALTPGERLKVTGQVNVASLDRSVLDEIVFGPLGASGDDQAEFTKNISLPFDGDIVLNINEATGFAPLPLKDASARFLGNKDAQRFTEIKANLANGQMAGSGEVRKNGSEALITFNGSLSSADLSEVFGTGISGKGDLQIELSAAGSSFEKLKSSLAGSGLVSSNSVILSGISTAGAKELFADTAKRDNAPDAIATLELAEAKIMRGQTALPASQTAFTVTSGVARAPRILLEIEGGAFAIEPKIDLNSGETEINAQLVFDTGLDIETDTEASLALSLTGPWNNLSLIIDPQLLQQFLVERALEREEARVETIQSALLEKQRLRRENRYYSTLIEARAKAEQKRLAEIEQLAKQAEQAKLELLAKDQIEREKLAAEYQKTKGRTTGPKTDAPVEILPLNLDDLIKRLDQAPAVLP